jgi:hypothetical protein
MGRLERILHIGFDSRRTVDRMPMTTPTDNDGNSTPADGTTLDDPRHDELLRQAIQKKLSSLSPEEGRRWLEHMLTKLTRTEIVTRTPYGDGEQE